MSKYRKVDPSIWNDMKFNSLTVSGKLAFLFLLTHPHMTPVGAMRANLVGLSHEVEGVSEKAFREALAKGMVKVDERACFVWLPNFLKYNTPENPNVAMAWGRSMQDIPECPLRVELLQHVKDFLKGYSEAFQELFRKGLPNGIGKQEQEQEQEQEQDKTYMSSGWVKPEKILELYHLNCPELPKVKVFSETRKQKTKARIKEKVKNNNGQDSSQEGYWNGFWRYVQESDFLCGRVKPTSGREKPFIANYEWLVTKSNFVNVIEGKYH
jgi:hypothetical protein